MLLHGLRGNLERDWAGEMEVRVAKYRMYSVLYIDYFCVDKALYTAIAPAVLAAVKTKLSHRNGTIIAFFWQLTKIKTLFDLASSSS